MYQLNDEIGNLNGVDYYSARDELTHATSGWVTSDGKFVIQFGDTSKVVHKYDEITLTEEAVQNILYALITNPERRVAV